MTTLRNFIKSLLIATAVILVISILFEFITNIIYSPIYYPVTKKGEFPFKLTYEQNGELVKLDDVYVCRFAGFNITEGGKFRQWTGYVKSTRKERIIVSRKNGKTVEIDVGTAMYYMGDSIFPSDYDNELTPTAFRISRDLSLAIYEERLSHADLYSEYGIKIIDWEFSEPIENTFRPKKWYERQFFY